MCLVGLFRLDLPDSVQICSISIALCEICAYHTPHAHTSLLHPLTPRHHPHHPRRFYWSINLGALISYTLVAYICQYGAGPDLGGEEWGFFVGYTIPSIMMCKYMYGVRVAVIPCFVC